MDLQFIHSFHLNNVWPLKSNANEAGRLDPSILRQKAVLKKILKKPKKYSFKKREKRR
jgi:hypothetical protein